MRNGSVVAISADLVVMLTLRAVEQCTIEQLNMSQTIYLFITTHVLYKGK